MRDAWYIGSGFRFFGNSLHDYLLAGAVFVLLLLIFKLFQNVLFRRLEKLARHTKTDIDDAVLAAFESIRPPFYVFIALYAALRILVLPGIWEKMINGIFAIWVVYQAIVSLQGIVDHMVRKRIQAEGSERGAKSALGAVRTFSKVILWILGALFVLSNLGVNVNSLLAGLGIGGVAIAFALQNILSDLFSSFAIYFDKPFVVGDVITVGDKTGTVERIGIKTTRLRALQGEEIVISNKELTSAHVRNFKQMKERRVTFTIGVPYETPQTKLRKVPELVWKAFEGVEGVRPDRAHFTELGDSALLFEVAYYVTSGDFTAYRNAHQEVLFNIRELFGKEKIGFAYPTQTVFVKKA